MVAEDGVAARIISLMPETPVSRFRINRRSLDKLARLRALLEKSDADILEDAIDHLLGTLERDQPVWKTAPSDSRKGHKPPRDAA